MRAYLLMVVGIGLLASMLTHRSASVSLPPAAASVQSFEQDSNSPVSEPSTTSGDVTELERSSDGHFYADVDVNGTKVHMLVDTGASGVALSREDARAAGIATSIGMNDVVGEGADGSVHGEIVSIPQMSLGETSAQNVPAVVLNSGERSLLGQSFLAHFDSIQIHDNRMTLR